MSSKKCDAVIENKNTLWICTIAIAIDKQQGKMDSWRPVERSKQHNVYL